MISRIPRLRPFAVIIWFGMAIGCNILLGNEEPVLRSTTTTGSSSSGGGGGSSSSSGGGGSGGACSGAPSTGKKGCGGGTAWAHWNPETPKTYTTTDNTTLDSVTGLMWERRVTQTKRTWQEAMDVCATLELDGYCDWRLPSRIELLSIVKYTTATPAIDSSAFPETPQDGFWTSSIYTAQNAGTNIYFDYGSVGIDDLGQSRYVRCVR